ncbi:MAG: M3 family metallopeptidase, partial [Bradymonadaceae bacterium]
MSDHVKNFPTSDPTWDLESIFSGGPDSKAFVEAIDDLSARVVKLREQADGLPSPEKAGFEDGGPERWVDFFAAKDEFLKDFGDARVFAGGMASSMADNPRALRLPSLLNDVWMHFDSLMVIIKTGLRGISDEAFETLRGAEGLGHADLMLRELRRDADQSMEPELEMLAVQLNRDGLYGWAQLYQEVSSRLSVDVVDESGQSRTLSVGQAKNLLEHPEREMRRRAYEGLRKAWSGAAPVCASALNSIIGSEQTLYRRRGTDELTHPLNSNRVSRKTIDAMHEAARGFQPLLVEYMNLKARLMGVEKLDWYDLHAPLTSGEGKKVSYEEAQRFISEQAEDFSSDIAEFCRHALANQWVEVEDRPGKGQGGYCATLPGKKEVRIFMTFGGTASGVTTLAHELGHGYHAWVMRDLPASQH